MVQILWCCIWCQLFVSSVPLEAVAFLGAVGAFLVLLVIFFLYLNKSLCFSECGGFPCIDKIPKKDKTFNKLGEYVYQRAFWETTFNLTYKISNEKNIFLCLEFWKLLILKWLYSVSWMEMPDLCDELFIQCNWAHIWSGVDLTFVEHLVNCKASNPCPGMRMWVLFTQWRLW